MQKPLNFGMLPHVRGFTRSETSEDLGCEIVLKLEKMNRFALVFCELAAHRGLDERIDISSVTLVFFEYPLKAKMIIKFLRGEDRSNRKRCIVLWRYTICS